MKLFKLLIIPLLLAFGYLILISYPYFFSKINRHDSLGFLSLVEEKSVDIQKTFSPERRTDEFDNHLLKGEKVTSKVKATERNFGILLFRFAKLSNKVSDAVIFRIKKEGERNWYYEHTYKADQFQPDQYFTFGFSPITESKNKFYVFEIESLSGTYKNGIGVSLDEPQVALVYKYTRGDLINLNTLPSFIFKKFVYAVRNIDMFANWQLLATFIIPLLFIFFVLRNKITAADIVRSLPKLKKNHRSILKTIINKIKFSYLPLKKKIVNLSKKMTQWFTSAKFCSLFLDTNMKKRLTIGLLIFLFALTYRFSSTLVNQHLFFYAGLGGQGDYDQFIRAATCALDFCSYAILGQNFLIETSILGVFYKIFGFIGGLKAYLYLMLIFSSIVAALPYLLLSRKNWITLGGIIGSLYLATSDFLTQMALNFPPDNGSLFTFSMFFLVYFITLNVGTIRWLLFFGLMGLVDGLNKALFLINDLAVFALFAPVFFYEKAREAGKSLFRKKNITILFLSVLPLLVFLIIYSVWEYIVQVKFSAPYWLRGLIQSGGSSYISYTSFDDSSITGNIVSTLFYLLVSTIVMVKGLIEFTDIQIIYLTPIFFGLLFFTFVKAKVSLMRFIIFLTFSLLIIALLTLIKENYFKIHEVFAGQYIPENWKTNIYLQIFLFLEIILLFILNFKYSALKLSLPIIFYVIMLITFARSAPFARLHTHVVAWSIILLAFIIDWIFLNLNKYLTAKRFVLGIVALILFSWAYLFPKMTIMATQLNSGIALSLNQVKYLKWVNLELPNNAIVLAGGKSDLVTVAENVKRPIIYNTLWSTALLIRPSEIPGISPTDFNLVKELKSKENFKKNRYIVLEDDIYLWRDRLKGVGDGIFTTDTDSSSALHAEDYSIKVYKSNPTLKKAIYELNLKDKL